MSVCYVPSSMLNVYVLSSSQHLNQESFIFFFFRIYRGLDIYPTSYNCICQSNGVIIQIQTFWLQNLYPYLLCYTSSILKCIELTIFLFSLLRRLFGVDKTRIGCCHIHLRKKIMMIWTRMVEGERERTLEGNMERKYLVTD